MTHAHVQTLLMAGAFLVFVLLTSFIVRSQTFAIVLFLIVFSLTDGIRDQLSLSVTASGFRISAVDVLCVVLLGVAAVRSIANGIDTVSLGIAWALVFLLVVHLARGISDFGLQPAVNGSRPWLYFLAPLLFAATAPAPWGARVWQLVAATGLVLAVVSIPYFLADGIHPASRLILRNGQLISDRPITASGALVILEAAILFLSTGRSLFRKSLLLALVALADVVALQQRTVWAAALLIGLVGFAIWSRKELPQRDRVVFGATGALLIITPFAVLGFLSDKTFRASLAETTARNSTFEWRTQSWQELVSSHHSPLDIVSGGPAGASWARAVNGVVVTQAPHNALVEAFLRFGAPGVALFCGLFLVLWAKRRAIAAEVALPAGAVGLILIAQVLFSMTYTLGPVQGLILGIFVGSLSLARATSRSRSPGATAEPGVRSIAVGLS